MAGTSVEDLLRADSGLTRSFVGAVAAGAADQPMTGTPSPRQIYRASVLGISVWRGTASTAPDLGLCHNEWEAPSRFSTHPCLRRC